MIRGRFTGDAPVVDCHIVIPTLGIVTPERLALFLDTGSSLSVLQPVDAIRLGLDPASITDDPRATFPGGVGGSIRVMTTTTFLTFDEDPPRAVPLLQRMAIAAPSPANATLPSILGMDFIRHFRLTVSVRERRVELDPLFDDA